jgi:uncharacterized membrane protein
VKEMSDDAAVKRDVDRLVAFSDGVFAIAITLLVVSLEVPDVADKKLSSALNDLGPQLFTYALSFVVIGAYWMGHHRMFRKLVRTDRTLLWINLVMLGFIALLPLPTEILGKYASVRLGVVIYAAAIAAVGATSCLLWWYMNYAGLNSPVSREKVWSELIDDGIAPLFFLISIPIAFVDVDAAKYFWILIWPANVIAGKRSATIESDGGPERHRRSRRRERKS